MIHTATTRDRPINSIDELPRKRTRGCPGPPSGRCPLRFSDAILREHPELPVVRALMPDADPRIGRADRKQAGAAVPRASPMCNTGTLLRLGGSPRPTVRHGRPGVMKRSSFRRNPWGMNVGGSARGFTARTGAPPAPPQVRQAGGLKDAAQRLHPQRRRLFDRGAWGTGTTRRRGERERAALGRVHPLAWPATNGGDSGDARSGRPRDALPASGWLRRRR